MASPDSGEIEVPEEIRDEFVIDTDFHAGPSTDAEALIPYIEDERLTRKMRVSSKLSFPSRITPAYATNETGGYHAHGAAMDGEAVLEIMERFGIDMPIITPGTNTLPGLQYPKLKTALCRATNDFALDRIVPADDAIKTHVALPIWDPEACVNELDRLGAESDVVGAVTWYGPFTSLLGEPKFDPVYEKLEKLDLPLALHVGGSTAVPVGLVGDSVRTRTEALGLINSFYGIMDVANMIMTGVFDKFPDLTVVCQEMGVTWIPFVANRMNEIYYTQPEDVQIAERLFDMGQEYLDKDPREYVYDDLRFSTQPIALPERKRERKSMLELCRADETLMYSSDWPHQTLDPVNWAMGSGIDEDLREQVLSGNAEEIYQL
jgi:predicted TIM-barrel fold metal-dependent hydrolase